MKKYIFLLFLGFTMQGCFVFMANKGWKGPYFNEKPKDKNLTIGIEIGKKPFMIPLPLLFIFFDVGKKYDIEFSFNSRKSKYKKIDSIYYRLFNENDSLLLQGIIKDSNRLSVFKEQVFQLPRNIDTAHFAYFKSKYQFKFHFHKMRNLKIDFLIYLTNTNNEPEKLEYTSCTLNKNKRGIFLFSP